MTQRPRSLWSHSLWSEALRPRRPVRLALLALAALALAAAGPARADLDDDGVADAVDDCPANPDAHQEDSDGDGVGDVCDPDTIDPILELATSAAGGPSSLHGRTPFYRVRVSSANGLEVSPEAGLGAPASPGIGLPPDPIAPVQLDPASVFGLVGAYAPGARTVVQSSWQTLAMEDVFSAGIGGPPAVRGFVASHANGVSLGYELALASIATGTDAGVEHDLLLPTGWTLDASEVTAGGGTGRLTVLDDTGTARLRIGAVEVLAYGGGTVIEDSPTFFGLTRLSEELQASAGTASVGPPDTVGSNFYGGIEAPLVETSYALEENLADGALGTTSVVTLSLGHYRLRMTVPHAVSDRNRATSSALFVGWRVSSLTPVAFGGAPGSPPPPAYGRHLVFFDDEAAVTGADVTLELHNALGTFDGAAPDYARFPNDGGTAALYDALSQQQTGFGCAGCTMALGGDSTIRFVGGGVGVGIAPGPRVGPADPCLASDPLNESTATGRCAVGKNRRASFTADALTVEGSMSGLVAGESDVTLGSLVFHQQHDPNATDPTLLHTVMGLGCAADEGVRIGVNPSNGDVMGNVPLDLASCAPGDVGTAACRPPALATPAATGICNLVVGHVELLGLGSVANPLGTDLTLPSGVGIALHARSGRGEIGGRSFSAASGQCEGTIDPEASAVKGFEMLASFSGGANVDPATGEPLAADDADAVPPNVYCMDNVLGDELGVGLVVGGNVDVRASHLQVERTLMGAIHVANGAANVETVASTTAEGTPCPCLDAETCVTPAQELACPGCAQGGEHFLAVATSGLSAPTRLTVTDSVLGLDESGVSSGGNPALPALMVDENLQAMSGDLTVARRPAGLFRTPVQVSLGPDTMFAPELLSLTLADSNIGVDAAALSIDNMDSAGGMLNIALDGNCYTPDGSSCIAPADATPVLAAAVGVAGVQTLNTTALANAVGVPRSGAGILPEPGSLLGLPSGALALAALHARRRRRAERARPGPVA